MNTWPNLSHVLNERYTVAYVMSYNVFPLLCVIQADADFLVNEGTKASCAWRYSLKFKQCWGKEWLEAVPRILCNILECIRKTSFLRYVQAVGRSLCYGSETCNLQHNNKILTINTQPHSRINWIDLPKWHSPVWTSFAEYLVSEMCQS